MTIDTTTRSCFNPNIANESGLAWQVAVRPVAILSCNRGRPSAEVRWTKWGRVVTTDSYVRVLSNGSLVVYDSGEDADLGVYNCLVDKQPEIIEVYKTRVFEGTNARLSLVVFKCRFSLRTLDSDG